MLSISNTITLTTWANADQRYAVTPHPVLPIGSARERRAWNRMKESARAAGVEIVEGIGALQTMETGADSVIGPTSIAK